ncbi:MAG: TerD family protein [Alphaproteobacteria bacterium]|nr:TerD family protein [Alphaproteobacteria bacterium]
MTSSNDVLDTEFEGKEVTVSDNRVTLGESVDILEKDPVIKKITIGAGWDTDVFNADVYDLDLCVFLLGRDGQTRIDEDFVFYNNVQACEGGVRHNGDSRTGAGDGDDESVSIDLRLVPFDVMRIVFVISIYKGREKQQRIGKVKNGYLRLVNEETTLEICRYNLEKDIQGKNETGMIVAALNREGPKWFFAPVAEFHEDGLAPIAKQYGISVIMQ